MKILHCVESYFPSKGGMQEVVKQLSERLVLAGHEVAVATRKIPERSSLLINGVHIKEFSISGNLVNGISGETEVYKQFLLNSDADVMVFFAAQQWATDLALDLLPSIRAKKVSVPTGYSGFFQKEYAEYFEKMKSWIQHYDMNVYLSEHYRDIDFARQNGVKGIVVIPNGAAENEFSAPSKISVRKQLKLNEETFLILHVGSYTGKKGHREAMEIFLKARLKNATLLMIGNDHQRFYRQFIRRPLFALKYLLLKPFTGKIIFGDFDREFTVAAYKQSNLFLFPSNIECSPIVLFECAAAGLPFVSTDVGNSVEINSWLHGGEILATKFDENGLSHVQVNEAVEQLKVLYQSNERRDKMSAESHNAWKEKFSWEKISQQYEQLYKQLLNDHH